MIRAALVIAFSLALGSGASAQTMGDWEQAGTRTVDPASGTQTVFAFGSDSHRQIRLCAANADLAVLSVQVDYVSGETQTIPTQFIVQSGQCSEAIELVARRRAMEKLVLTYTPFTAAGRPPRVRVDAR